MSGYVYALVDPDTLEVKYIGQTTQRLNVRLNKHLNDAKRRPLACYPVYDWIRLLVAQGKRPIIEAISSNVQSDHLDRLETMWISLFKTWGHELTNTSPGGNGLCHTWKKVQQSSENSVH